ncbi:hypothetical protein NFI96_029802, partial [Prochilodus magdalenae]
KTGSTRNVLLLFYPSLSDVVSEEPNKSVRPLRRNSEGKFSSRSLRLNNNIINDLQGLTETLSTLFTEPKRLAWLDLSFNDLSHIHPVLRELTELLYVISNLPHLKMMDFSAVTKQERALASIWHRGRKGHKLTNRSKED